jgi:hypothetical protein
MLFLHRASRRRVVRHVVRHAALVAVAALLPGGSGGGGGPPPPPPVAQMRRMLGSVACRSPSPSQCCALGPFLSPVGGEGEIRP